MAYSNKPMRRSALIGPWGVGAIVPFPNDESLMIAGLDMWRYNDATPFIIKDERLQRRLGASLATRLQGKECRSPKLCFKNSCRSVSHMALLPILRYHAKNNIIPTAAHV